MTVAYGWVASETKTVCDYCCCVTHVESSLIPRHVWEEEMSFGTRLSGVYIRSTMPAYNVKLMVPLSNRNQVIYIHMSMYMQPTTKKHCLHDDEASILTNTPHMVYRVSGSLPTSLGV